MEKLLTVAIPCYNSQDYVKRAIDSLLPGKDRVEVVVVDDGSTDRTGEIADKAAENDDRIEVIHQKNAGVAATRNRLIERSRGDYILQVDADDYISAVTVDFLYGVLNKNYADMAVCSCVTGDRADYEFPDPETAEVQLFKGDRKFEKLFDPDKFDFIVPWEKLYKKELFQGLKYPDGKIHEDEYLAHYLMERAERIAYIKTPLFYYTIEKKGITKSKFSLKRIDAVPALLDRNDYFEKKRNPELLKLCYLDFLKRFQYFYYGIRYHYPEKEELRKDFFHQYEDIYIKACKRDMLTGKEKILFGFFLKCPGLNYLARKLFRKKAIDT